MESQMKIYIEEGVTAERRDDWVRNMWSNLYNDYLAYLDDEDTRVAVNERLAGADPDELLVNWTFVLFRLANEHFRAQKKVDEHEFVVQMQDAGVVACDPASNENILLHSA